jgi:hypothetical protein
MSEITRERNMLRFGRVTEEKCMTQVALCRIARRSNAGTGFRKHNVISFENLACSILQTPPVRQLFPKNKKSFGNKIRRRMVLPYDSTDKK